MEGRKLLRLEKVLDLLAVKWASWWYGRQVHVIHLDMLRKPLSLTLNQNCLSTNFPLYVSSWIPPSLNTTIWQLMNNNHLSVGWTLLSVSHCQVAELPLIVCELAELPLPFGRLNSPYLSTCGTPLVFQMAELSLGVGWLNSPYLLADLTPPICPLAELSLSVRWLNSPNRSAGLPIALFFKLYRLNSLCLSGGFPLPVCQLANLSQYVSWLISPGMSSGLSLPVCELAYFSRYVSWLICMLTGLPLPVAVGQLANLSQYVSWLIFLLHVSWFISTSMLAGLSLPVC